MSHKFDSELNDAIQCFAEMASHLKLARCRMEASYLSFREALETSEHKGNPQFEQAAAWMDSIYAEFHSCMEPLKALMDHHEVQRIIEDGDRLIAQNGITGLIRRMERDLQQYFD